MQDAVAPIVFTLRVCDSSLAHVCACMCMCTENQFGAAGGAAIAAALGTNTTVTSLNLRGACPCARRRRTCECVMAHWHVCVRACARGVQGTAWAPLVPRRSPMRWGPTPPSHHSTWQVRVPACARRRRTCECVMAHWPVCVCACECADNVDANVGAAIAAALRGDTFETLAGACPGVRPPPPHVRVHDGSLLARVHACIVRVQRSASAPLVARRSLLRCGPTPPSHHSTWRVRVPACARRTCECVMAHWHVCVRACARGVQATACATMVAQRSLLRWGPTPPSHHSA
jgi:hypothetical protein